MIFWPRDYKIPLFPVLSSLPLPMSLFSLSPPFSSFSPLPLCFPFSPCLLFSPLLLYLCLCVCACVWCLYTCVHLYVSAHANVCTCMWRLEVKLGCYHVDTVHLVLSFSLTWNLLTGFCWMVGVLPWHPSLTPQFWNYILCFTVSWWNICSELSS